MNEAQVNYYRAWLQENIDHFEKQLLRLRDTWKTDDKFLQLCQASDMHTAFVQSRDMFNIIAKIKDIGEYGES